MISRGVKSAAPLVLVVESDVDTRHELVSGLRDLGYRIAAARSANDAVEMLSDLKFIGARIDGLLVSQNLSDGSGWRIISDFRREFPELPAAIISGEDDISLQIWSNARGVSLFPMPLQSESMTQWLSELKISA
jgi:CheY-like chemotaxis protein